MKEGGGIAVNGRVEGSRYPRHRVGCPPAECRASHTAAAQPSFPHMLSLLPSHLLQLRCLQCRLMLHVPHPRLTCINTTPLTYHAAPCSRIGGPPPECRASHTAAPPPSFLTRSRRRHGTFTSTVYVPVYDMWHGQHDAPYTLP